LPIGSFPIQGGGEGRRRRRRRRKFKERRGRKSLIRGVEGGEKEYEEKEKEDTG
jgi:hypothetical protein